MSDTKTPTSTPANDLKPFAVRLSEAEKRRIKALAASQGLTLRQAILEAFEVWASLLESEELAADLAWGCASRCGCGEAGRQAEGPVTPT